MKLEVLGIRHKLNKSDYICSHHKNIIEINNDTLSAIQSLHLFIKDDMTDNDKGEIKEIISDIILNCKEIEYSVKIALEQGIKMEDRMRQYNAAIIGLGFKRNKKKTDSV